LRLSTAEKSYIRRSWPLLALLREALRTEQNVRFALLFGSAARGEDSEGSDIDLLVEMRDSTPARRFDLNTKLEELLGRRVDVVDAGEAEANPRLLAAAAREGRVLVDRAHRWPKLRARGESLRRRASRQEERRKRDALAGIDRMLTA
jgi:predicted nucleotidyltransferase